MLIQSCLRHRARHLLYTLFLSSSVALLVSACGSFTTAPPDSPESNTTPSAEPTPTEPVAAAPQTVSNSTPPTLATQPLTRNTRLGLTNFGPVRIGMTIAQAETSTGMSFEQQASGGEEYGCLYYLVPDFDGLALMVTDNKIARIELSSADLTTLSGAKLGYTEGQIRDLYPGQIEAEGHEYIAGGKNLLYIPQDENSQNYRVIFETDAEGKVIAIRSGKIPEVRYIEGCV